jgi:7,8-dihydropterin-6-yl-methyl-4-(beta-D-ribofuranosyl)aminobenzene 5'-phosphate synthase
MSRKYPPTNFRLSPFWWPLLGMVFPIIVPWLIARNRRFRSDCIRALELNQKRINQAEPIPLPELDFVELTVLVEWKSEAGFIGDSGISYLFKTELGSLLFDVGFGPTRTALTHNASRIGFTLNQADALAISHLHGDHMGGIPAWRSLRVDVPDSLMSSQLKPCFLPDHARANGFEVKLVEKPQLMVAGIASIGPLARSLFIMGYTEEQALLARLKDKGLLVFTACGHPPIEVILEMVKRLSNEPVYALGGGLHLPVTNGRGSKAGIQFQAIMGTGKPPWKRITDKDLSRTINAINNAAPKKIYLSGHDTCDYALERMRAELNAETEVLKAGAIYRI